MKTLANIKVAFLILSVCWGAIAEEKGRLNASDLNPGASDTFFFSNAAGADTQCDEVNGTDCCDGTLEETYAGVTRFTTNYCKGRYNGKSSATRYGIRLDTFHAFRSILNENQIVVVNSNAGCTGGDCCPTSGSKTYNWLLFRARPFDAYSGPMDMSSDTTYVGGTVTYNHSQTVKWSGSSKFSLNKLDSDAQTNSDAYGARLFGTSTCSGGEFKASSVTDFTAANRPLGNYGYWFFGKNIAVYRQVSADPLLAVAFPRPATSLTASGKMAEKNKQVFTGVYTGFTTRGVQVQRNLMMIPDAAGTTFTLSEVSDPSNPFSVSSIGTLACTNLDQPSQGFCRGTLSLTAVPGQTGKATCMMAYDINNRDLVFCSAQNPTADSNHRKAMVTIAAVSASKSVLTASATPVHLDSNTSSGQICTTVQNLTSRAVSTISITQNLSGDFSSASLSGTVPTPFSGIVGSVPACGTSMPAFSKCQVCSNATLSSQKVSAAAIELTYDDAPSSTKAVQETAVVTRGVSSLAYEKTAVTKNKTPSLKAIFGNGTYQNIDAIKDKLQCSGTCTSETGSRTLAYTIEGLSNVAASDTLTISTEEEICYNNDDDDNDGTTDCLDNDCDNERGDITNAALLCNYGTETNCADSFDNDKDGNVDCDDGDCLSSCGESNCVDVVDNDNDGRVDCADSDCLDQCDNLLACAGDCYLEGSGPNYAQDLAIGTERKGPSGTTLTLAYAVGSSGFKVWKEKNGSRILNASGFVAKGWQKKLTRAGTAFSSVDLTSSSNLAGRVCPPNVFINYSNMTATNRCLYYDAGNAAQTLDAAGTSGVEGEDWLRGWGNSSNTPAGGIASFYVGNIKTCSDKGMRLPTIFETNATTPTNYELIPEMDYLAVAPTWAESSNGVPPVSNQDTWTGSAPHSVSDSYSMMTWVGADASISLAAFSDGYTLSPGQEAYVRCVLPNYDGDSTNSEVCNDNADNDNDGVIDCADAECNGADGGGFTCENGSETNCTDGYDNDRDTLTDSSDASDCSVTATETCNDSTDNDGDGFVDCADTSDCSGQWNGPFTCESSGETSCTDGYDNDGDSLTDCADSNCSAYDNDSDGICNSSDTETCNDGIDNDGNWSTDENCTETSCNDGTDNDSDSQIDCADSDCSGSYTGMYTCESSGETSCTDGYDNDGDSLIDCADSNCSAYDNDSDGICNGSDTETCNDGIDNNGDGWVDENCSETSCGDGIDNDSDMAIDCADSDCFGQFSNVYVTCEYGTETSCTDGYDNDGDGLADSSDTDCPMSEVCNDGTDNDSDGYIDCADSVDCMNSWVSTYWDSSTNQLTNSSCETGSETYCNDGYDNDGDGLTDLSDTLDCSSCTDSDSDTYGAGCAGGTDCDDTNSDLTTDCTFTGLIGSNFYENGTDIGDYVADAVYFTSSPSTSFNYNGDLNFRFENGIAPYSAMTTITTTGTVTFTDVYNYGTIYANTIFNGNSENYGTINGSSTFNGGSICNEGCTLYGTATFNENAYIIYTSIYADVTFNGYSGIGNSGSVTGNVTFNEFSATCGATIIGDVTLNGSSNLGNYCGDGSWVTGNATFNDNSVNGGTVSGTCTYNESSTVDTTSGFGTCGTAVEGNCTDGGDNDSDAQTDCADSDCNGQSGGSGTCEYGTETNCTDGYDNDGDGLTDTSDTMDCSSCTDSDSDGYGSGCSNGADCDDTFSDTSNMCCSDADGDGYGTYTYNGVGCGNGADCNDSDSTVNYGQLEICGDYNDNDCNGLADDGCQNFDQDGDGYAGYGGCSGYDDCDDYNASVNPNSTEQCGDGVDNNCDCQTDEGCDVCGDLMCTGTEDYNNCPTDCI